MDTAASRFGIGALKGMFALLVLFLYAPLLILLLFSFNDHNLPVFPLRGFTTDAYRDFVANEELRASIATSAKVAVFSSAITVVLGVLAALVLVRRNFFGKPTVSVLLLSPLVVPLIALAIGLLVFLNRVPFMDPGLRAIVAGHVVLSLPYAILILAPRLERIDARLEEAARDLGATPLRTFRSVTLPLIMPAIVSSFLVSFTISFDEIVVASFVNGDATTFPLYLYSQLRFPTLLPQVMAVAVVVMFASVLLLLAAEIGRRVAERRLGTEPSPIADPA